MITSEGAGVVAQIIPLGLLIIGFEIRIVPKVIATGRAGSVLIWIQGISLPLTRHAPARRDSARHGGGSRNHPLDPHAR